MDQENRPAGGWKAKLDSDNVYWQKFGKPSLLAVVFQYAYLAYFIGLQSAVALTFIDGGVLLGLFVSESGYPELKIWIIKTIIQWPLLGILAHHGYLDWLGDPERSDKKRMLDAVLFGGMIVVVTANILILIHKAL